jgi:hypothetical protein
MKNSLLGTAQQGKQLKTDDLDSLNAKRRSKGQPAQAIRRAMEATLENKSRKRRRQEPSLSRALNKAAGA